MPTKRTWQAAGCRTRGHPSADDEGGHDAASLDAVLNGPLAVDLRQTVEGTECSPRPGTQRDTNQPRYRVEPRAGGSAPWYAMSAPRPAISDSRFLGENTHNLNTQTFH